MRWLQSSSWHSPRALWTWNRHRGRHSEHEEPATQKQNKTKVSSSNTFFLKNKQTNFERHKRITWRWSTQTSSQWQSTISRLLLVTVGGGWHQKCVWTFLSAPAPTVPFFFLFYLRVTIPGRLRDRASFFPPSESRPIDNKRRPSFVGFLALIQTFNSD